MAGLLVSVSFALAPLAVQAATNTFTFSNTTINSGAGPANPANGATSISGASLTAGDVVVLDCIVINVPGSTADAWGAINLNQTGGYLGVVGARLGVLAETGTTSGNRWQLFLNGSGSSTQFGTAGLDAKTNRLHIELTCTTTGSTTNMNYLVQIDQGATGTYNDSLSAASAVTFPGNTIALTFGANNAAHLFVQAQPIIAVSAPSPATNTVVAGFSATFTTTITQGFPINTTQQWRSNGVPIVGATNLTYTTPPASGSYNGTQYSIVVTNLLTPGNVVTSSVAYLFVRSTPGIVTFDFPTTTVAGGGAVADPGVSISGSQLLAGDVVVFDGIVIPNGSQAQDAWTAINIQGGGYGGLFGASGLAVLTRTGSGANPSQLFINGSNIANPTSGSAPTNRVRIELYPSVTGSTTNMGWVVKIDQNLSGTFQPAITGTNKTFVNNVLPLTFGSSGDSSTVIQDPQSPVSIFAGPVPLQVVAVGAPISVGVTVKGWAPAFQWRKNGAPILNATNQNYTLAAATLGDNGDQFTVVVSNRLNSLNVVTSSVANVSVLIPNNQSWYPAADLTTWDTTTANWTTNGGVSQTLFTGGNNVTFDSLGYNLGGNSITVTNVVNPNAMTVNAGSSETFVLTGTGSVNGQSLLVTGDGTGTLGLQATASFATATIDPGSTLDVGYAGFNGSLQAGGITNNGVINFFNSAGTLAISGRITGSGTISQYGAGVTVLSATNSAYAIDTVNAGVLSIASTPNAGAIVNNAEIQPASAASVLTIPNAVSGTGHYFFTGFQTTVLTGVSSFTGLNTVFWSDVIVDNAQALGDTTAGKTVISGADRFGGLYLSNNLTWSQPMQLDTRYNTGAAATAPHVANLSGTNTVTSALTFATGSAAAVNGTDLNVEVTAGQLTIAAASTLTNNANSNPNTLNLQGPGTGIWNGVLANSSQPLSVTMRGAGTWTLGGTNTYTGSTTVGSGTLLINGQTGSGNVTVQTTGTLGGIGVIGGAVNVAAGGTLAPGSSSIGTLTINSNLTLAPGGFLRAKINKTAATEDQIVGVNTLTYGGTLVVSNLSGTLTTNDAFQLFSATSYVGAFAAVSPASPGAGLGWNTNTLATDGTLRIAVASSVATNRTNITTTVVGGNTLKIAWPTDHIGWTLEAQTNSLSTGLSTNWTRITASATTNQVFVPITVGNGSVFYRLVYP